MGSLLEELAAIERDKTGVSRAVASRGRSRSDAMATSRARTRVAIDVLREELSGEASDQVVEKMLAAAGLRSPSFLVEARKNGDHVAAAALVKMRRTISEAIVAAAAAAMKDLDV